MNRIRAIFENGVFRPTDPVQLPERCEVEFTPTVLPSNGADPVTDDDVYAVLSERYASGRPDVAARHDEHQP